MVTSYRTGILRVSLPTLELGTSWEVGTDGDRTPACLLISCIVGCGTEGFLMSPRTDQQSWQLSFASQRQNPHVSDLRPGCTFSGRIPEWVSHTPFPPGPSLGLSGAGLPLSSSLQRLEPGRGSPLTQVSKLADKSKLKRPF